MERGVSQTHFYAIPGGANQNAKRRGRNHSNILVLDSEMIPNIMVLDPCKINGAANLKMMRPKH